MIFHTAVSDAGIGADGQVVITYTLPSQDCPGSTTVAPSTIQTYRQLLFQTVYRLDPNYPGQTEIRVNTISINPSPLAKFVAKEHQT